MDSGKSVAGKQSKPSHFDAAARGATAKHRFITPEPGMSLVHYFGGRIAEHSLRAGVTKAAIGPSSNVV
jgi:hypothetical protein